MARSPVPLLLAVALTVAVSIGSWVTRDERVAPEPAALPRSEPASGPSSGPRYVAIGDSFTAGSAIGAPQKGSGDCLRSTRNYPSLVARQLGFRLRDVSCSGATTRDVLANQLAAVTEKTSVVTVSIGGNDFGIYTSLLLTCMRTSKPDAPGSPCRTALATRLARDTAAVATRVGQVLDAVRDRAPEAKLLVVGYLRLMPSNRTCTAIPFSRGDVAWFAAIEKTLSDSLLRAARSRDLPVVDMRSASDDHDVCAGSRAWVNGPRPKDGDGILYHPNGAGERAVARAVVRALRS